MTSSGIIPPFPSTSTSETSSDGADFNEKNTSSSKLLGLIRLLEKKKDSMNLEAANDNVVNDYYTLMDEIVTILNHCIAKFSRYGLLEGNVAKAERILSSSSQQHSGSNKKGSKKKNNNNQKNNDLRIIDNDDTTTATALDPSASGMQQQMDETLLFTGILRVLPSKNTNGLKSKTNLDVNTALLISLVSEVCLAISQHIKSDTRQPNDGNVCVIAEYELLMQFGKTLLTGLTNAIQFVIEDAIETNPSEQSLGCGRSCLSLVNLDDDRHTQPLISTIKATCSLVDLFGTKLSRSTVLLEDIQTIALKCLTLPNDNIQDSASRLLSCLPFCGGSNQQSPSDLWTIQVTGTLFAITKIIQVMAPLNKNGETSLADNTKPTPIKTMLEDWIQFVRQKLCDENLRSNCFYLLLRGYTRTFCHLIYQDGTNATSNSNLMDAQMDIQSILNVIEALISFPISAETVYYKTKRRLRNETLDGGLLSPQMIVTQVANYIKQFGHEILDCCLAGLGGSVLLPYARRIFRLCYASILTSCSGPVRKVMDPINAIQLEGKKRRWLHLSIAIRTVAIGTFDKGITILGYDIAYGNNLHAHSKPSSRSPVATTDTERAISLVVGCLLEQIIKKNSQKSEFDDDWGTLKERTDLVVACTKCLESMLTSCGGYLKFGVRSLIESVVSTTLLSLNGTEQLISQSFYFGPVKASILQLAGSCLTTPWQDGTSSSLIDLVSTTARRLETDTDIGVAMSAKYVLHLCDSLSLPRAPALLYVSRAIAPPDDRILDATAVVTGIQSAVDDNANKRQKEMEDEEEARKKKTEEKRHRDKEIELEKSAKRQKSSKHTKKDDVAGMYNRRELRSSLSTMAALSFKKNGKDAVVDDGDKTNNSNNKEQESDEDLSEELLITKHSVDENDGLEKFEQWESKDKFDDEHKFAAAAKMPDKQNDSVSGNENDNTADDDDEDDDEEMPDIFVGGPDSDDE